MRRLIYCIVRDSELRGLGLPAGINGEPLSVLAHDGPAAVFSTVSESDPAPSVPGLKTYAAVIQAINERCTVLPMRYGCLLATEADVSRFLREHRAEFLAALDEVDGCVEMGIRVMPSDGAPRRRAVPASRIGACRPGMAYLEARRSHYSQTELAELAATAVVRDFTDAVGHLSVRCKTEWASVPGALLRTPALCMYFLVKRHEQEAFRQVYREWSGTQSASMFLSGPWPPWNFVRPHD